MRWERAIAEGAAVQIIVGRDGFHPISTGFRPDTAPEVLPSDPGAAREGLALERG